MDHYYVNKRAHAKGQHEVHRNGCVFMPGEKNRYCLGVFKNCAEAVLEAKKFYPGLTAVFSVPEKRISAEIFPPHPFIPRST